MHYFEFGKRDTTLYSGGVTASINTGFDEILELKKEVSNDGTLVSHCVAKMFEVVSNDKSSLI